MAPAHVRRAAAAAAAAARRCGSTAAAGRCASPVHHGSGAPIPLARPAATPTPRALHHRAAAPIPLARAAATPTTRALHHSAAATPTPRALHHRAAATPTPRALHHRAATLSFTPRRRFTGNALVPVILEEPPDSIPSFIIREVSRIESADIARHRELGQVVSKITRDVTKGHSAAREGRVKNAIHAGTVTWRICTTVITVTVAAGAGLSQLAKPGWEAAAEEEALMMITEKVGEMMLDLEEGLVKGVAQRRAVSSERSLLVQQQEKAVAAREKEVAAREVRLNIWDAELSKKEAGSN